MKPYQAFELEDFLLDESFLEWVQNPRPETDAFWQNWIKENPAKEKVLLEAKALILSISVKPFQEIPEAKVEEHIQEILENISQKQELRSIVRPVFYRSQWLKIAASIIVLVGLAWTFYTYQTNTIADEPAYNALLAEVKQPLVEQVNLEDKAKIIHLSDGSSVTMYKNSRLSFPKNFEHDKREVYLTGNAFFSITKAPQRPFYVHAGGIVTRVLGTSFFVKAPAKSKNVEVEVITGKVSVFEKKASQNNGVILTPNQKVTYFEGQNHFVTGLIDNPQPQKINEQVQAYNFDFSDTPLSEVLEKLSLAYGVRIEVDNEKLYNCPLTANITQQPLYTKLEIICEAINGSYEIKGTAILVSGKGCDN